MTSSSSWHPAFMPNTTADVIPTKSTDTQPLASAETHLLLQKPDPSLPVPTPSSEGSLCSASNEVDDLIKGDLVEDNAAHPELTNLRNVLTTSLASPGGV